MKTDLPITEKPAVVLTGCYVPLHCPFCGSKCETESTSFGDSCTEYYRVTCQYNSHSLDEWSDTIKEAVDSWNLRSNGS